MIQKNWKEKIMKKEITLNLDQATFEYLEVLAFGLNQEVHNGDKENEDLLAGHDKIKDDFAPLVTKLLEKIADSLADGVRRPNSWEREIVDSLTGWDGTVNRGMFGASIDIPKPTNNNTPPLP